MSASGSTAPASAEGASPSLVIHTLNVVKDIKPSADGQAADAVHHTLHYALDGRQEDWEILPAEKQETGCGQSSSSQAPAQQTSTSPSSTSSFTPQGIPIRPGFFSNPIETERADRPYISFAFDARQNILTLPHPATIPDPLKSDPCGPENREAHDVTAKFFYPETAARAEQSDAVEDWVEDALQRLRASTGLVTVDTLVLAFEGISKRWNEQSRGQDPLTDRLARNEEEKQDFLRDVATVARVWSAVSQSPFIQSLGLADLPLVFLQALFNNEHVRSSLTPARVPSSFRLPKVISQRSPASTTTTTSSSSSSAQSNDILLAWCKSWPSLVSEASEVTLLGHSDPQEALPAHALPGVLSEFQHRLPFPGSAASSGATSEIEFRPKWSLRYTVLIRDRGLLADKGYIIRAAAS